SAGLAASAPSSIPERSFRVPPKVPKPARTPESNTPPVLEPWVFIGGKLHARRGEYRGDRGRAVGRGLPMPLKRKPRLGPAAQAARSGPFTGRRRAASSLAPTTAAPRPYDVRWHSRRHDAEPDQ